MIVLVVAAAFAVPFGGESMSWSAKSSQNIGAHVSGPGAIQCVGITTVPILTCVCTHVYI